MRINRRRPVIGVVSHQVRALAITIVAAVFTGCTDPNTSTHHHNMTPARASYEDSIRRLQKDYLEPGDIPPMPKRMPRHDDEELGVTFFRTFIGEHDDLSNLTLRRTFFGRSEINDALFCNTDLTESCLCWNDFFDVDFSDAVLASSDLRASNFTRVKFVRTDLRDADLRRSSFENCTFEGALFDRAVLTQSQGKQLALSETQRQVIAFTNDEGPEPDGG